MAAWLPAFAEEHDLVTLEEVTVSATRTPRKMEQVTSTIDVVTTEDVENTRGWNVGEALESVPGVQAQTKNGAYDTHIIIRGAGAKASYGVREIMVMVDGIPITDPDSFTRLDMVDTSTIDRIEVVKGPNSTMYGANAAGGSINIITKNPYETQGTTVRAATGTENSYELHLQNGGELGGAYYVFSATHKSTDSWRDWNEFTSTQLNGRLSYMLDDDSDLDLSVSYTESDLQLPGTLTEAQFLADPTQRSSSWQHSGRYSDVARVGLGYRNDFGGGNEFITKVYAQRWSHYHPVPTGINDGGASVYGADVQQNVPHEIFGSRGTLSVGLSAQRDDSSGDKYTYRDLNTAIVNGQPVAVTPYTLSDASGTLMESSEAIVDKLGVFAEESVWLTDATVLDVGLRYDTVMFDVHNDVYQEWSYITTSGGVAYFNYKAAPATVDIDRDWNRLSPRIGVNHTLGEGVNLYATVSTGFQTPIQSELETNEALDPQTSVNYETGIRLRSDAGNTFETSAYYTSIENEVIKLMDGTGLSYYDNAGSTTHMGLEVSGALRLTERLSVGFGYAYSDFTFDEYLEMERAGWPPVTVTHDRAGNRIPLIPMHQYSTFINYRESTGFHANLSSVTWDKYYVDTANTNTYGGFSVLNGKVGYEKEDYSLYLIVQNIMDKKYASEVGESYGNVSYSPAPPRTLTAGVSYTF
jgi:iron complex outermembrane receptor protein